LRCHARLRGPTGDGWKWTRDQRVIPAKSPSDLAFQEMSVAPRTTQNPRACLVACLGMRTHSSRAKQWIDKHSAAGRRPRVLVAWLPMVT
jgi:hypothetical protein